MQVARSHSPNQVVAMRLLIRWRDFLVVLGRRKLWGIYFGHVAWGTTSTFFLTWFPTYLVTYRHLDFIKAGLYASLPFVRRRTGRHHRADHHRLAAARR